MPYYPVINQMDGATRARSLDRIKALRRALSESIPQRTANHTLLLATWNIREFDSAKYGMRTEESFLYIAEIVSRFDLIAIQEVRESLYALQRLQRHLGSWWDYLVTDVTLGQSGNSERMAFLYDRRKVTFSGVAAEVVLPKKPNSEVLQFARSPYVAGFRCGWAQVNLCTVHIYYGTSSAEDPRRLQEIRDIAQTLVKYADHFTSGRVRAPAGDASLRENLILLGDFNIFNRQDKTMQALTEAGFRVPEQLKQIPGSNVKKNKHYDQIAYLNQLSKLSLTGKAGVFDFYEHVYRDLDRPAYAAAFGATNATSYEEWRTYQMSDHLPMWAEFKIDDADTYLDSLA